VKILLAPSETKTIYNDSLFDKSKLLFANLLSDRNICIDKYNEIISSGDEQRINEIFGLKKQSDIEFYRHIISDNSQACKAIKLYTGVAFDYLDYSTLNDEAKSYIEDNVIIFSNLFGAVKAGDNLPLYRLQQGKKLGELKTENIYKKSSSLLLEELLNNEDILDIRAGYYDKFYTPNKNYTTLKFLKGGKVVSHFAKAYRGKVLREIAIKSIHTLEEFMAMNINGLELKEIQTRKNRTEIIYNIGA
jgi:hypothetical protein